MSQPIKVLVIIDGLPHELIDLCEKEIRKREELFETEAFTSLIALKIKEQFVKN